MTAPKMQVNLAYTPQMIDASGQFVVPANSTTPNQQVAAAFLSVGSPGVSQITPTSTQSPMACMFQFFCTPNSSAAQPNTNNCRLPSGVVTTAQTAGSEFLIDCSAISADLISAQAGIITPGRGAQTLDAVVSAVDNVNKLVYVQVVNWASGAVAAATTGSIITFQIVFKDTYGM